MKHLLIDGGKICTFSLVLDFERIDRSQVHSLELTLCTHVDHAKTQQWQFNGVRSMYIYV